MFKLIWSGLLAVLLCSGCGWNGTPTRHNDFVPLKSIKIVAAVPAIEATHTIAALTSTKLTVIGDYGIFTRDITDQAVWTSDTPAVAGFITTVNPNRVTGHQAGSSILTATVGTVSGTYALTVSSAKITVMTITPANTPIASGFTAQFSVNGTFTDSTTQDLTFDAVWTTDTSGFASISNDPVSKGLAKGLAVGTATISATFDGLSGTAQLNVTGPLLQSVTVLPANSTITGFSKTQQFTATAAYSDGTTPDITSLVTWASSQSGVATIATGGLATAVAAGTTSISATLNGISGSTNLTVTALALNLTPTIQSLAIGASVTFKLTATAAGGTPQDVTSSSVWASSSTNIATVNSAGVVTGVSAGSVTITVTYSGQPATATFTVL